jgi:hypothetical protein
MEAVMKRPGLLVAVLSTAVVAICTVKAAGWFEAPAPRTSSRNTARDAERWYLSGQETHWRCCMLQQR